ncbi:MAG: hypothetical protein QNJ97_27880, partial [Myxococcota bacterium]|nr:hypothetical protein [Myxococcota bacterium]
FRLEQRLGRIARLGSSHETANVFWFAPHRSIERRLLVGKRIASKSKFQLDLEIPSTSTVGRARIVNNQLMLRERLAIAKHSESQTHSGYAVVKGPATAITVLEWLSPTTHTPELITIAGDPPRILYDYVSTERLLTRLVAAVPSPVDPPKALVDSLLAIVKDRLSSTDKGTINKQSRRLTRLVLSKAYSAGLNRNRKRLNLLDSVLEHIRSGLTRGSEESLEDLLCSRTNNQTLQKWLTQQRPKPAQVAGFRIKAAIFGDGTVEY